MTFYKKVGVLTNMETGLDNIYNTMETKEAITAGGLDPGQIYEGNSPGII